MRKILIALLFIYFLIGIALPLSAAEVCQLDAEERKLPEGASPKMNRYLLQGVYLGMSFKELALVKQDLRIRPAIQSGVIHEYHIEHFTADEHFLFMFSWDGRLYKLVYTKEFAVAVDEQALQIKLSQKYGKPDRQIDKPGASKIFEYCWGQCQMIRENVFCHDQDTDYWYTYFTASLSIHRKHLSMVLHDSKHFKENEEAFVERKTTKTMAPSTSALNNLKL